MIKVGLTGNRYSGKDVCSKIFQQIDVPVFNADIVLKFILNYNYEINYKIRNAFGDVFSLNGDLLDINKFKRYRGTKDLRIKLEKHIRIFKGMVNLKYY